MRRLKLISPGYKAHCTCKRLSDASEKNESLEQTLKMVGLGMTIIAIVVVILWTVNNVFVDQEERSP